MLAEVVAWESHMRAAAGTAAADPRNPDVQATLEKWHGEIEAMSEIELGIDPGSTVCDKFVATISGSISSGLKKTPSGHPGRRQFGSDSNFALRDLAGHFHSHDSTGNRKHPLCSGHTIYT